MLKKINNNFQKAFTKMQHAIQQVSELSKNGANVHFCILSYFITLYTLLYFVIDVLFLYFIVLPKFKKQTIKM